MKLFKKSNLISLVILTVLIFGCQTIEPVKDTGKGNVLGYWEYTACAAPVCLHQQIIKSTFTKDSIYVEEMEMTDIGCKQNAPCCPGNDWKYSKGMWKTLSDSIKFETNPTDSKFNSVSDSCTYSKISGKTIEYNFRNDSLILINPRINGIAEIGFFKK